MVGIVMAITTIGRLTGYAQADTVSPVTDKTLKTGYTAHRRLTMETIILLLVMVIGFTTLGLASIRFGADSRDRLPDSHVR